MILVPPGKKKRQENLLAAEQLTRSVASLVARRGARFWAGHGTGGRTGGVSRHGTGGRTRGVSRRGTRHGTGSWAWCVAGCWTRRIALAAPACRGVARPAGEYGQGRAQKQGLQVHQRIPLGTGCVSTTLGDSHPREPLPLPQSGQ